MLTFLVLLVLVSIFGGTAALAAESKVLAFVFAVALIAMVISTVVGLLTIPPPKD